MLERVPLTSDFHTVPATHGDGFLLIAEADGGLVAVAPPWSVLSLDEPSEERLQWRVGWWSDGEDGADLSRGPQLRMTVSYRVVHEMPQLIGFRDYLRDLFRMRAQAAYEVLETGPATQRERAEADLVALQAEWRAVYRDAPWPGPLAPGAIEAVER